MAISGGGLGDTLFKVINSNSSALAAAKVALAEKKTAPAPASAVPPSRSEGSSGAPTDVIRLSDEAKQALRAEQQRARQEIIAKFGRLRVAGDTEEERQRRQRGDAVRDEFNTYNDVAAERTNKVADSLFGALGVVLPTGPDPANLPAAGIGVTGAIIDVLHRNPDLPQMAKSAALQAWEAERDAESDPVPPLPEIMNKVSEVYAFLPGTEGHGSNQVSAYFDNASLEKLASMSEEQLRASLKAFGSDTGVSEQVKNSNIGAYMASGLGIDDPKVAGVEMAGFAVMDPDNPAGAPLMTLHSRSIPDHVREKGVDMIVGMVNLLKRSYPAPKPVSA